mmetsp:Transcript_42161/g.82812  ORF Transcript_42161/g.82812 Transcript_42161/m.82812 type:complete len:567 (-) Transcript_42161:569-2269(-)
MGNFLTHRPTKIVSNEILRHYSELSLGELEESLEILNDVFGDRHDLNQDEFDEVFGFWMGDSEPDWVFWAEGKEKIDIYTVFAGIAAYCNGKLEDKIDFIFGLFDFDGGGSLNSIECYCLIMVSVKALCQLAGIPYNATAQKEKIKELAKHCYEVMDVKNDGNIELEQFKSWVLHNRTILNYVHDFTENMHMEKCIGNMQKRMDKMTADFEAKATNNKVTMPVAMDLLSLIKPALNPTEKGALADIWDDTEDTEVVGHYEFDPIARGLIAFDIIDKLNQGFVLVPDVFNLLWVMKGHEPKAAKEQKILDKIAKINPDIIDGEIRRLEWIKCCAVRRAVSSSAFTEFNDFLHGEFDKRDVNQSGTITFEDFQQVLYALAIQINTTEEERKHLDPERDHLLHSLAKSIAGEVYKKLKLPEFQEIMWASIKMEEQFLWQRQREVAQWVDDVTTHHFADVFAPLQCGNRLVDIDALFEILNKSIQHLLKFSGITKEESEDACRRTAKKIMDKVDVDHSGHINPHELKDNIDTCVQLEKELIEEMESLRKTKVGSLCCQNIFANRLQFVRK